MNNCKLFDNISEAEYELLIKELNAKTVEYFKDATIIQPFDKIEKTGMLICGQLKTFRYDADGNIIILSVIEPGDIFGEAISNSNKASAYVYVQAEIESKVLWLDIKNLKMCNSYTNTFMHNLVGILSDKILSFNLRISILSRKKIRDKILMYLKSIAMLKGKEFRIPFNRNDLADYLGVNRTALSRELSKMKADGLIEYSGKNFTLKAEFED